MYERSFKGLLLKASDNVFLSLVSVPLMRTLLDLSGFSGLTLLCPKKEIGIVGWETC